MYELCSIDLRTFKNRDVIDEIITHLREPMLWALFLDLDVHKIRLDIES